MQANPKRQPTFASKGLSGKAAVLFDGIDDVLAGNITLASTKTVFAVFAPASKWQADSCCSGIATFWAAADATGGASTNGVALKSSPNGNVIVLDYAGENDMGNLDAAAYNVSVASLTYSSSNSTILLDDCAQVALQGAFGHPNDLFAIGYRASDPVRCYGIQPSLCTLHASLCHIAVSTSMQPFPANLLLQLQPT